MEKLIARHDCIAEDGTRHIIEEWQQQIRAGHQQDPHATIPGMKRLVTSRGMRVNYIDQATFEIVQTGQIVRKV